MNKIKQYLKRLYLIFIIYVYKVKRKKEIKIKLPNDRISKDHYFNIFIFKLKIFQTFFCKY